MRRFFAASALTAALFGAAACNATGTDTAGGGPSPSVSPSPSATLSDKKTTCGAFTLIETTVKMKMVTAIGDAFKVASETDPVKQQAAVLKFVTDMKTALSDFRTGTTREAAQAADPELKAALTTMVTEMSKLEAAVDKVKTLDDFENMPDLETDTSDAAAEKIKTICKAA